MSYYEEISISISCGFCSEGPLECECEDVNMDEVEALSLDDALAASGDRFSAIDKLGRAQTETLIGELALDSFEPDSWKAIKSLSDWI